MKDKLYSHTITELRDRLNKIQAIVDEQAEDPALWSFPIGRPEYISEAHLKQELRRLHAAVEDEIV